MALVWEVFAEFQAPEFTQEGIEEFWRFIDGEYMNMMLGEGIMTFWGAFEDDLMVGVCAVRDNNHIALLFVDGEYHRRGIGSTLLKKAVADCKYLDPDLNRVTVNSSPYAVPFYEAMGFKALSGMLTPHTATAVRSTPIKEAKSTFFILSYCFAPNICPIYVRAAS